MFRETWLTALTPYMLAELDAFRYTWVDRTVESGKRKGEGLVVFVNNRCCNSGDITIKEQLCSRDIERLAISFRPHYLPWDFSYITMTVYISTQPMATQHVMPCSPLWAGYKKQHPNGLLLISGDLNHVSPLSPLLTFNQYITCFLINWIRPRARKLHVGRVRDNCFFSGRGFWSAGCTP